MRLSDIFGKKSDDSKTADRIFANDSFSVQMSGIIDPTDEDMAAINQQAKEPLMAEDIYVFPSVISTDLMNLHGFRMADSSLDNFAVDAQSIALMIGHDTDILPIGRSFEAVRIQTDEANAVAVKAYFLRDCQIPGGGNTDDIARLIKAGITTDISVGWGGADAWFKCSICDKDMMNSDCPHIPGIEYDAVRAFAWLEDAHLREFSLVYKGSDPGASILCPEPVRLKAERLALAGTLSASQIDEAEANLGITLPRGRADDGSAQEDRPMLAKALLDKLRGSLEASKCSAAVEAVDQMRLAVKDDEPAEGIVDKLGALLCVHLSASMLAFEIMQKLNVGSIGEVDQIVKLAETGKQYRTDLITQTLEAGVRAYGDDFQKDLHERLLNEPGRTLDDVKAFNTKFEADAVKRLGEGGRQTTPSKGLTEKGKSLRDYSADEFDALPEAEQQKLIDESKPVAKTDAVKT